MFLVFKSVLTYVGIKWYNIIDFSGAISERHILVRVESGPLIFHRLIFVPEFTLIFFPGHTSAFHTKNTTN